MYSISRCACSVAHNYYFHRFPYHLNCFFLQIQFFLDPAGVDLVACCRTEFVEWHMYSDIVSHTNTERLSPTVACWGFCVFAMKVYKTSTVMASYRPLCPSNPVLTTRKALNLFCGKMRWCFIASKRCLTRFRDKNWTVIYTPLDTDIHLCAHFRE